MEKKSKKKTVVGRNARPYGNTQFVAKIHGFSEHGVGAGYSRPRTQPRPRTQRKPTQ